MRDGCLRVSGRGNGVHQVGQACLAKSSPTLLGFDGLVVAGDEVRVVQPIGGVHGIDGGPGVGGRLVGGEHGVDAVDAVALLRHEAGEYQFTQAGGDAGTAELEQGSGLVLAHLGTAAGLAAGAQGEQDAIGRPGQVQGGNRTRSGSAAARNSARASAWST